MDLSLLRITAPQLCRYFKEWNGLLIEQARWLLAGYLFCLIQRIELVFVVRVSSRPSEQAAYEQTP